MTNSEILPHLDLFKAHNRNGSKWATLLKKKKKNAAVRKPYTRNQFQFKAKKGTKPFWSNALIHVTSNQPNSTNRDVHTPFGPQKQPFIGLYYMAAERDPYARHIPY